MTKFKIFSPYGIEVCTIEAESKIITDAETSFYDYCASLVHHERAICEIPKGWVSIPEDVIVKNTMVKTVNDKTVKIPSFEEAVENSRRFFEGREK